MTNKIQMKEKIRIFAPKIFLFLFSLGISLLCLEFFLRYLGGTLIDERKNVSRYSFEKNESKEKKISSRISKKNVTVLTLGDSYTFGGGLPKEESYPFYLQELFNHKKQGPHVEVINGGICEATSSIILENIESAIAIHSPDLVFLLVGASNLFDFTETRSLDDWKIKKIFKIFWINLKGYFLKNEVSLNDSNGELPTQASILRAALKELQNKKINEMTYNAFRVVAKSFQLQSHYSSSEVLDFLSKIDETESEIEKKEILEKLILSFQNMQKWEEKTYHHVRSDIIKMKEILDKENVKLVLMTYPVVYKSLNSELKKISGELHVPLLDLFEGFEKRFINEKKTFYIADDDHATAHGHEYMAQLVFSFFYETFQDKLDELSAHGREIRPENFIPHKDD